MNKKMSGMVAITMIFGRVERKIEKRRAALIEERDRLLNRASELEREMEDIERARNLIDEACAENAAAEFSDDGFDRIAMGC